MKNSKVKRIARMLLFGTTLLWLLGGCTPEEMLLGAGLIDLLQDEFQVGLSAYQRGDYAAAHGAWRPLAERGHAEAQYNLGLMYNTGRGVPRDDVQAAHWYRMAADQGVAPAQHNVGVMFAKGQGIPQDDIQAARWFRTAADQGLVEAQAALGLAYAEGSGVPQDDVQAMHWYRMAADQGAAEAQFALGLMYLNVRYVKHVEGVLHVGVRRMKSELPTEDVVEAARWFHMAAHQGYVEAQAILGFLYAEGQVIPQDDAQAYAWLNIAAAQGNEDAKNNKEIIAQSITREDLARAQKLTREYWDAYVLPFQN